MLAVAATVLLGLSTQRLPAWVLWHDAPDAEQPFFRDVPERAGADPFLQDEYPRPAGPVRRVVWSRPGWLGEPDTPFMVREYDGDGSPVLIETRKAFGNLAERTTFARTDRTVTIERSTFPRVWNRTARDPEPDSTTVHVWTFEEDGSPLRRERVLDGGRTLVELRFEYDEEGRIRSRTALDESGYVVDVLAARHDPRGRLDEILYGAGGEPPSTLYRLEHDLADRVVAVLDADGRPQLRNAYGPDGRIVSRWRAAVDSGGSALGEAFTEVVWNGGDSPVEIQTLRFAFTGGCEGRTIRTFSGPDRPLHSLSIDVTGFVRSEASFAHELDERGNWIVRSATPNRPTMPDARVRETSPHVVRTIAYHD